MGGRGSYSATVRLRAARSHQRRNIIRAPNNPDGYSVKLQHRNLIFVSKDERTSPTLMNAKKSGQVYIQVANNDIIRIIYFDKSLKRSKQIDLDHRHSGLQPHVHHGYFHQEYDKEGKRLHLTKKEQRMVDRVTGLWHNYINKSD